METQTLKPQAPIAYGEYAALTAEQKAARAREKLQEFITREQARARTAVQRILTEVPQDAVVRAPAVRVGVPTEGHLQLGVGDRALGQLHSHALDQLATRLGMPTRYVHELQTTPWGRRLVAENLNTLAREGFTDEAKFLVRAVDGQVRGVLSPGYRTDDSRPALDALIGVAQEEGAVIAAATALDTKTSVKVMLAEPVELFPGEWAVFGLDYRNSDYGDGAREIMGWVLRLLCLNGAVTTSNFRRVHLGARIKDEAEYSARTRKLNAEFTASATRDMAKALLGRAAVEKQVERVRAANAKELDPQMALRSLKASVNKAEEKAIVEKYNSPDIELLPPGNTAWRFSNAISWLANQTEDSGRKLELEQLAGSFID